MGDKGTPSARSFANAQKESLEQSDVLAQEDARTHPDPSSRSHSPSNPATPSQPSRAHLRAQREAEMALAAHTRAFTNARLASRSPRMVAVHAVTAERASLDIHQVASGGSSHPRSFPADHDDEGLLHASRDLACTQPPCSPCCTQLMAAQGCSLWLG